MARGEDGSATSREPDLIQELEYTRLLVDEDAWERAGHELRRRDPARYVAILKVVEEICLIHADPLAPVEATGHFVFPRVRSSDPD